MTDDRATNAEEQLREQALSGEAPDEDTAKLAEAVINRSSDEPTEEAGEAEEPAEGEADPAIAKVRKEAASYCRKLREAEQERDSLRARAEAIERREVERTVSGGMRALADGSDLWVAGVTLDELRGEDGSIDQAKVDAARERVLEQHPHWKKQHGSYDGGARPEPVYPRQPDLAKHLRDAAGG